MSHLSVQGNPFTSSETAFLTALSSLPDPGGDRILFWDDSAGTIAYLEIGANLSIVGTVLSATGGSGSGITRTIVVTSGSTTLGATASTDYTYYVTGAHTLSMPSPNSNRYTIKNLHSVDITIDTVGAETIEGSASIPLAPNDSVDIMSDGTNWYVH